MTDPIYEFESLFNQKYSNITKKIMRMLSENARVTDTEMAKKLGITRQAVAKRLTRIDNGLKIKYTLELNEEALGLVHPHLIIARFDEKPDYEHIEALLKKSHIPQFAAITMRNRGLLIYANSTSRSAYAHWDKGIQMLLADYKASWYSSEIAHRQLGFFPIRSETLDTIKINDKYREIIGLLNSNSRASLKDIAKSLGIPFHVLIYNFKKLLKTGYIRRFTIVERPVPHTKVQYYFAKLTLTRLFAQCAANARKALVYDDQNPLISRYSFCSQLIGSNDFFAMGVFDNKRIGYRNGIQYYKDAMESQKVKMMHGVIDKVLVGNLPLRSIDNKKEYHILDWNPELKPE